MTRVLNPSPHITFRLIRALGFISAAAPTHLHLRSPPFSGNPLHLRLPPVSVTHSLYFANSGVNLFMEYEGELNFSNFWVPNMANEMPSSCTRAHTCNPLTGPDALHTHTCFHMHTKTVTSVALPACETGEINSEMNKSKKNKRPLGNREAVRKYREKKKAWAASLEDEVMRLRIWNKQLLTMHLDSKAAFEAEIERLK